MKNLFEIGDIVRVVNSVTNPINIMKRDYVNKIGFIIKFDDRYNDFSSVHIKFFHSDETMVFNKSNIVKEADFVLEKHKYDKGYFYEVP
jgi:hypothetical protein